MSSPHTNAHFASDAKNDNTRANANDIPAVPDDRDGTYPEQKHAGVVGYGPQYNRGADFGEKVKGIKEQVKGRVMGDPELVQLGRERMSGALKEKQRQEEHTF